MTTTDLLHEILKIAQTSTFPDRHGEWRQACDTTCLYEIKTMISRYLSSAPDGAGHEVETTLQMISDAAADAVLRDKEAPGGAAEASAEPECEPFRIESELDAEGFIVGMRFEPSPSDDVRSALADELERISCWDDFKNLCVKNKYTLLAALRSAPVSGPAQVCPDTGKECRCPSGICQAPVIDKLNAFQPVPAVGVTREAMREPVPDATVSEPVAWADREGRERPIDPVVMKILRENPTTETYGKRFDIPLYTSPQHADREPTVSARDAVIEVGNALEGRAMAYRQDGGKLFSGFTIADEMDKYGTRLRSLASGAKP